MPVYTFKSSESMNNTEINTSAFDRFNKKQLKDFNVFLSMVRFGPLLLGLRLGANAMKQSVSRLAFNRRKLF